MDRKISVEDASRILSDVKPEQCFWVNNGPILRNLHELEIALKHMNDQTFRHHLNEDKNDFANWAMDVLEDKYLAEEIKHTKSREKIIRKIKGRIKALDRIIEEGALKAAN